MKTFLVLSIIVIIIEAIAILTIILFTLDAYLKETKQKDKYKDVD